MQWITPPCHNHSYTQPVLFKYPDLNGKPIRENEETIQHTNSKALWGGESPHVSYIVSNWKEISTIIVQVLEFRGACPLVAFLIKYYLNFIQLTGVVWKPDLGPSMNNNCVFISICIPKSF